MIFLAHIPVLHRCNFVMSVFVMHLCDFTVDTVVLTKWSTVSFFFLHSRHMLSSVVLTIWALIAFVLKSLVGLRQPVWNLRSPSYAPHSLANSMCYRSSLFFRFGWCTDRGMFCPATFCSGLQLLLVVLRFGFFNFIELSAIVPWQLLSQLFQCCYWCCHWVPSFLLPACLVCSSPRQPALSLPTYRSEGAKNGWLSWVSWSCD
jgi:hypothetical protein